MEAYSHLLLYLVAMALLSPGICSTDRASATGGADNAIIGAILDCSGRVGKEERVAMEMAIEDLNKQRHHKLILRVKCSRGEPIQAAQAARHLINKNHVQAILGPYSWEESLAAAEVAKQFDVPILSLSEDAPPWATTRWQFFIQATPSTSNLPRAVAAIIESWGWRQVNVIYEDAGPASNGLLNHLYGSFQDTNVQISSVVSLPSFASFGTLRERLRTLKRGQCRVFVVHASLALAERVFQEAKEMKMMEEGYVWITTGSIASLVHSLNASVISSIQGVLGVRRYLPDTRQDFQKFNVKFLRSFRQRYPKEKNHEPGTFALEAYDIAFAAGSAIKADSNNGRQILGRIEEIDVDGLSGRIKFEGRKLAPVNQFQIINVFGRSYRELGFWSDGSGFSTVTDSTAVYSSSMRILGRVFWPGGPWTTPRGWDHPTISNPLKIGVPNVSLTNKFVQVEQNPTTNSYVFSGYSIEIFQKIVQNLKYPLPYQFIPYGGKYTDLVKQVKSKQFDAAVGDIAIVSTRYEYVEFSHAHTESGVVMVVPIQPSPNRAWLFVKPFTKAMWLLTGFTNVYNGFVIWSIERNYCAELRGPFLHQMGTFLWMAFATLFSLHGERLHSNLSKMATVVWLFLALIIMQSYTASLSSLLTAPRVEPEIANTETLLSENAMVGCSKMSFVRLYLETALHFKTNNIKNFSTTEEYAKALRSGEISAAFLEVPVAKLFVAKYCKSFTIAGPTYKVGGYGFAFPKGSPMLPDIDEALLRVFETGEQKDLEKSLIASEKCVDLQADNGTGSLSPHSFCVLFIFSGGTSTAALALFYCRRKLEAVNSRYGLMGIWFLSYTVLKLWKDQRNGLSRKVSDVESPTASPNSSPNYGHT